MAKKDEEKPEGEGAAVVETADSPLLDLSDAAVKKMIKAAKKRGFVTYAELNAVLPSEEVSSDQIEDVYAMLSEMGITVTEDQDDNEGEEGGEEEEAEGGDLVEASPRPAVVATRSSEPADRTDDPVRMYLREMGSVELLSREGEIAIAKRIEAGRETMIAGLCESPLTFQASIIWRDELNEAKILLREIIDLEATYAGPEAKQAPVVVRTEEDNGKPQEEQRNGRRQMGRDDDDITNVGGETRSEEDDEEEVEVNLSLAAMEAE
ncbi:MAG: RNA polymerase sigma factor region1.1 domain-containing protein, partial [Rhodoblastus sp.]